MAPKKNPTFVPKNRYFPKEKLAAYPSEDGTPFHLGKGQDEKRFFKAKSIRETRSKENEEMFHRPGMSLALSCSAFDGGAKLILKRFEAEFEGDQKACLQKTGLLELKEILLSEKGQRFTHAVNILNVGREKKISTHAAKSAIDHFMTFHKEKGSDFMKALARCASFSATSFLFSMTLLKDLALLDDLPSLADNMECENITKAMKAWKKDSGNVEKFKEMLLEDFMLKVKKNGTDRKRKAADSSDEADDDSSDSPDDKKKSKKSKSRTSRAAAAATARTQQRRKIKEPRRKRRRPATATALKKTTRRQRRRKRRSRPRPLAKALLRRKMTRRRRINRTPRRKRRYWPL